MQPTIDSFQLLKDLILKLDAAQDLKSALGIVVQTICQQCKWSYGEAWQLDPQTNLLTNQATFHETDSVTQTGGLASTYKDFSQFSETVVFALREGIRSASLARQLSLHYERAFQDEDFRAVGMAFRRFGCYRRSFCARQRSR